MASLVVGIKGDRMAERRYMRLIAAPRVAAHRSGKLLKRLLSSLLSCRKRLARVDKFIAKFKPCFNFNESIASIYDFRISFTSASSFLTPAVSAASLV